LNEPRCEARLAIHRSAEGAFIERPLFLLSSAICIGVGDFEDRIG
jgi:hypothetical protein